MVEFGIRKKPIVIEVKRSTTKVVFLKILNFHPIDLKFEEDLYFRSRNSTCQLFFEININGKVNIGRISKIVNFHSIDLKFEEELHIWSLNSTTNYF